MTVREKKKKTVRKVDRKKRRATRRATKNTRRKVSKHSYRNRRPRSRSRGRKASRKKVSRKNTKQCGGMDPDGMDPDGMAVAAPTGEMKMKMTRRDLLLMLNEGAYVLSLSQDKTILSPVTPEMDKWVSDNLKSISLELETLWNDAKNKARERKYEYVINEIWIEPEYKILDTMKDMTDEGDSQQEVHQRIENFVKNFVKDAGENNVNKAMEIIEHVKETNDQEMTFEDMINTLKGKKEENDDPPQTVPSLTVDRLGAKRHYNLIINVLKKTDPLPFLGEHTLLDILNMKHTHADQEVSALRARVRDNLNYVLPVGCSLVGIPEQIEIKRKRLPFGIGSFGMVFEASCKEYIAEDETLAVKFDSESVTGWRGSKPRKRRPIDECEMYRVVAEYIRQNEQSDLIVGYCAKDQKVYNDMPWLEGKRIDCTSRGCSVIVMERLDDPTEAKGLDISKRYVEGLKLCMQIIELWEINPSFIYADSKLENFGYDKTRQIFKLLDLGSALPNGEGEHEKYTYSSPPPL